MTVRPLAALLSSCALALGLAAVVPASATAHAPSLVVAPAAVDPVPIASIRVRPTLVLSGLSSPTMVTSAADGTDRLFVVERAGRVRTVSGGRVTGTFLDIRSLVASGGERGMLGLAFAPDFARSHLLWVTYTRGDGALVLARFATSSATAPTVIAASRKTILVVPHPGFGNHNGGYIGFGPGGLLFLGTGDGGGSGDPRNNAQNLRSLLGKMLRINVRCPGRLYCAPSTNPFTRVTGARKEIWMVGLRNPWRWSFDPATGAQWIGDVGQGRYEEIDAVTANAASGRNLGWSCREGLHLYKAFRCSSRVAYKAPAAELCHPDSVAGCPSSRAGEAIIGGFVYRGSAYPGFVGTYVFGDFVTGRLWPFRSRTVGTPTALDQVSGFGTDDAREMYAVTLSGGLYRIGFASA